MFEKRYYIANHICSHFGYAYAGIALLVTCMIYACQAKDYDNLSKTKDFATNSANANPSRYTVMDASLGLAYLYSSVQCSSDENTLQPVREGFENAQRLNVLQKQGIAKHHRYLDCLLWVGHQNNRGIDAEELASDAPRYCGMKTFCSVRLKDRKNCVDMLTTTVKKLDEKNLTVEYDGFHTKHTEYIKDMCGYFYPALNNRKF